MYQNFAINSADDLVKGFAILLRNKEISSDQIRSLIMDCTNNDNRLTQVVLEKVQLHIESMDLSMAMLTKVA